MYCAMKSNTDHVAKHFSASSDFAPEASRSQAILSMFGFSLALSMR